MKPLQGC